MWGIGFSVVQTRMRKLLKRLIASPMRKREYLLAQVGGRLVFLAPEAGVPLIFGALVLGMPIQGSIAAICVVCLVGALAFGGVGLLLACRARTFEAISGLMNLSMVPMWVLSGVFFSSANFPQAVQPAIQALPLTALINALRAVVLEGSGIPGVARELAVLAAWGLGSFGIRAAILSLALDRRPAEAEPRESKGLLARRAVASCGMAGRLLNHGYVGGSGTRGPIRGKHRAEMAVHRIIEQRAATHGDFTAISARPGVSHVS
jgi:hypothetical protein